MQAKPFPNISLDRAAETLINHRLWNLDLLPMSSSEQLPRLFCSTLCQPSVSEPGTIVIATT